YIRALQLSQNATASDIPPGQKVPSPPPQFRDIGNGATLPEIAPAAPAAEGSPNDHGRYQEVGPDGPARGPDHPATIAGDWCDWCGRFRRWRFSRSRQF